MEPFWDLKISILYVEYLIHVSSEYITSWMLLSLTSTADRTSRFLLAAIINKASLVLYTCITRTLRAMPWPTWCSEAVRTVEFVSCDRNLSLLRSRVGLTPSLWLRCRYRCGLDCVRTILTTFYHINYAAAGDVVKFFILHVSISSYSLSTNLLYIQWSWS